MIPERLDQLVDSLLWEGYALYPYTPGATKNATPTPFGIVYPPAYARTLPSAFDHLLLRGVLEAPPDAVVRAEVRFLTAAGDRRCAPAQRLELPGAMVGALAGAADQGLATEKQASAGGEGDSPVVVSLSLGARMAQPGVYALELRVENRTVVPSGLERAGALARSLLSTHPILRVNGGRFRSPLECDDASVNTFPVLATESDDALLGAAIVLPDHPQIAPESLGSLFDSTEIEEALLLHVRALSDGERAEIEAAGDPALSAMLARAASATPAEIVALHGRASLGDPGELDGSVAGRGRETLAPPSEPPDLPDPRAGEELVDVDGVSFRRGGKIVIRPGPDADVQARMLDGHTATIERIFTDYDGRVHLGVTVDDDPGQELMRATGRYLYFFAPEVEVIAP